MRQVVDLFCEGSSPFGHPDATNLLLKLIGLITTRRMRAGLPKTAVANIKCVGAGYDEPMGV